MIKDDRAFEQWQTTAQPGELQYHVQCKKPDETLQRRNCQLFEGFGFEAGEFSGKTVVDVGAGSHLKTRFFQGASVVAIEPLANEYLGEIDWCELSLADVVHAESAEKRIVNLEGAASLVVCINVLDHTYDPVTILDNIYNYLHEDGQFLLSVDLHDEASDGMHPVELTVESLVEMLCDRGFAIDRGYHYLPYGRKYGHGEAVTFVMHRRGPDEPSGSDVQLQPLRTPGQLVAEEIHRRTYSICRRIKRILTGESRGLRRLFGRAA